MNLALVSAAAASIIAGIAAWHVQSWRYEGIISDIKYEQSEAARKVFESVQRQHELDIAQKDKAIHEATLRAQKNQALARTLDSDVDSLRAQLASASTSMPATSCEAVRSYSNTIGDILGESVQRYSDVARTLDQCTSDVQMMQDAWPSY